MNYEAMINQEVLNNISVFKDRFNNSLPYRHVVIEDFLDQKIASILSDQIPSLKDDRWVAGVREYVGGEKNIFESSRYAINDPNDLSNDFVSLFKCVNSKSFCKFLSSMTGIDNVMPDMSWHLSGLRLMTDGGHQLIHSDSRVHPTLKNSQGNPLEKKLTMLIYMNKEWLDTDIGSCELWNDSMTECVKSVAPSFNKCLIFECTDTSYHGVPKVECKNKNRINLTFNFLQDSNTSELRPKAYFIPRPEDKHIANFEDVAYKRAFGNEEGVY